LHVEKQIKSNELLEQLDGILSDISTSQVVYFVTGEVENWRGDKVFVLGPRSICGKVLGLIDVEYGWPKNVKVDDIESIQDLAPSYRRHPFIYRDNKCLAVGIQVIEYEMIMEKQEKRKSLRESMN